MSKGASFEIKNLDKWIAWLKALEAGEIAEMNGRIVRAGGLRALEIAQDFSKGITHSGRFKQSLAFADRDNVFNLKVGNKSSYVVIGTLVPYARCIEYGWDFSDRRGEFVPGFWKGGTFHYIPKDQAKAMGVGGMILNGVKVKGYHVFQETLDAMPEELARIAEFEFKRLYAKLFK